MTLSTDYENGLNGSRVGDEAAGPGTQVCRGCGKELPLTEEYFYRGGEYHVGFRKLCRKCYNAARRGERKFEPVDPGRPNTIYQVVHDPDVKGGYPQGAQLERDGLARELAAGHMSLGMILRRDDGKLFRVKAKEGATQTLEEVPLTPSPSSKDVRGEAVVYGCLLCGWQNGGEK